jgi:hypothetical protein
MKIFKWKHPAAKYAVGAFVLLFLFGVYQQVFAAEVTVQGGVATGYSFDLLGSGGGDRGGALQASLRTDDRHWDVSVGYIGEQYDNGWSPVDDYLYLSGQYMAVFDLQHMDPFLGLGLMVRNDEESAEYLLPSSINFALSGGLDIGDNWRLEVKHFSNAGTKDTNRGQNLFLFGYRF